MKHIKALTQIQQCETNYDKLKLLVESCPSGYLMYLKNHERFNLTYLMDWILLKTPKLADSFYSIQTKVYWILNNIEDFPLCEICKNPLVFVNVKSAQKGYSRYVCNSTDCKNKLRYIKISNTMMDRYGFSNNFSNPNIIEKIKQHNIETYGNACPANNKEIRHKIEEDNLKKYGVKSYSQTDEWHNKVKNTNLKNFGVDNPAKSKQCRDKSKATWLEKYGVDHPLKSQYVKDKMRKHLYELYGDDYTHIVWGNKHNIGQYRRSYNEYMLTSKKVKPLFSLDEFIEDRKNGCTKFKFQCKKCHKIFTSNWDNGGTRSCPYCMQSGCSGAEQELYDYLLSFINDADIKHNDRTVLAPLELDFYISKHNIAIEYDGLYWHNDDIQPNFKYHLNKTLRCEEQGIQLVHIFENEWLTKQDIVKSRLKNLLGVYDKTVYARTCKIREIDSKTSKTFQKENHIQGSVNAKVNLGLFFNDELISLMTFGKCRFNKKYEWELLRFCNKLGYHIPGGASKLLTYFERTCKPTSLISYADRRWSRGVLYEKLGFTLDHTSSPNYWYFNDYDTMELKSRVCFQKHKLSNILEKYNANMSEVDNMKMNGYKRIFDCGNLVFVKKYFNV